MNKTCDLHTHSVFSDGTYTPTQIVDEAIQIGLSAVALTDHNTVDGLSEFLIAAKGKKIEAIPGAEFSVDFNGKEVHLLGLFIPEAHLEKVSAFMKPINARKEQSNIALVNALNKAGYEINYDEIKSQSPNGQINRLQIAQALTQKGYTESTEEAFATLLSKKGNYYVPPTRLTIWTMLEFLKQIQAVPILAHPFLDLTEEELKKILPVAKENGLVGMECYYSTYTEKQIEKAKKIADEFGVLYSGGSDFHGDNKPSIKLGIGKGNLEIPYNLVSALKKELE